MFAESLYLLILLSFAALAISYTHNPYILIVLFILCIPLVATIISVYCAPFVPSNKKKVETMFKFAKIVSNTTVYDLGAGDGRLVMKAQKLGANAVGYEISFPLVLSFYLRKLFDRNIGKIYWKSLWKANISDADVVFLYLLDRPMAKFLKDLYPTMKKGTRIISNTFEIPGLKAKKIEDGVYLYIK